MVEEIFVSIQVDDDAIESRQFHEQQVVLDDCGITRVVRPAERIIMRRDLASTILRLVGIERIHGPMPTPTVADRLRFKPRHVMHEDDRRLVRIGCVREAGPSTKARNEQ